MCPAPLGTDDSYDTGTDANGKRNFPISWKGSKTVWKYSMVGENAYVFRHAFPNNAKPVTGTAVRTQGYAGFLYFGRKFCGSEFLAALLDGRIKIDLIDYTNMYDVNNIYYRDSGSKSALVVQFRHTIPAGKAKIKTDLGNSKNDQVWVRYTAKKEDFVFKSTVEGCLNKVNIGVLKYDWGMDEAGENIENWSQCAAWSYNIS